MITLNSQQITIKRVTLLEALRTNLETHKRDYAEAVENYRISLVEDLTQALAQVSNREVDLRNIQPVAFQHPISYEDKYVEMIEMFEMSEDETVTLDGPAFRSYIKDQWGWKSGFEFTKATYASKASLSGAVGGAIKAAQAPVGFSGTLNAAQSQALAKRAIPITSESSDWPFPKGKDAEEKPKAKKAKKAK